MYHLIYHSTAREAFDVPHLTSLLKQSRTFNLAHDITGILLYTPDRQFMQILEGPEEAVRHLYYDRIAVDARHSQCAVLSEGPWARRSFPDWQMSFLAEEDAELCAVPGYVELNSLQTLLPALAAARPALVHLLLDFIDRFTDRVDEEPLAPLPE